MSAPSRNLERWLDVVIRELGESVKEFHPIRVRLDGERACLVFRWCDDPNTYEMCSSVSGDVWSWDEIEDTIGLIEELRTGFLVRAIKTRSGPVLRADLDAEQSAHGSRNFYLSHYRSEWFGSAQPLADAGLDVGPGEAARNAGTLLDWCVAKANTRTGGPALGQLVTVRDSETEGQIAHLEMTRQAGDDVGHDLVFAAIHHAARSGIYRLYSPRDLVHLGPFEFAPARDRPNAVVYDITARDLNWPPRLTQDGVGSRTTADQAWPRETGAS